MRFRTLESFKADDKRLKIEMTWSFASPDGQATFQFVSEGDAWVCVWRRIGDHGVFGRP